jgi:site-specific DNA recombinase
MDLFNENSCAFNSLMESIDTHTPSGRMFIKIIGIFAEFERENIIERVCVALEKKVREGYILSNYNIVPYGYSRQIGQREITINVEESRVVKEIFNLYLHKHKSFNAIATELNRRGILSSTGVKWGSYPVSYILSNPIYMGKVRYSTKDEKRYFEAEGKHEAIISEEMFSEVKSKMAKMQRIVRKRPREENYFCGTLMCGECGKKMATHNQYSQKSDKCYNSYVCTGKKRDGCKTGNFSHNKVETAFREYIEGYEDLKVEPTEIITIGEQNHVEEEKGLKADYETALAGLLKKEKDIMTLYISDKIDYNDYTQMLSLIKIEKKGYENRIAELENTAELSTEIIIDDIVNNFKDNWVLLTNLEKMQFLQTYIEAIFVTKEAGEENPDKKQIKVKRLEFYRK